jgi:hypothetical protein
MKLVKKDCGKHFGEQAGPCAKCGHFARQLAKPEFRAGLQYGGTPWNAVTGPIEITNGQHTGARHV